MPLPPGIASAVVDPDFWHDYLGLDSRRRRKKDEYPEIANHAEPWSAEALAEWQLLTATPPPDDPVHRMCRLDFPVGPRYSVRLTIHPDLDHELDLVRPDGTTAQLGWMDCHNHKDALRCEELDLIGRCQALADPALPHPGVPALLLHKYTPLTGPGDVGPAAAVLRSAAAAVGLDWGVVGERLMFLADHRPDRFVWRSGDQGWWLEQDGNWLEDRLRRANSGYARLASAGERDGNRLEGGLRPLHTLRQPGNADYPFADMKELVADAWRACRSAVRPGWRTAAVTGLARAAADGAFDRLPVLADALEEAGCDHGLILAHLRHPDPARGAWVVELLLDSEWGSVLAELGREESGRPGRGRG